MSVKYLIVWGDVVDGFSFVGPFDDGEEADAYAEAHNLGHYPKIVAEMETPE